MPLGVQKDLFGTKQESNGADRLVLVADLSIPGKLPSWNDLLGMEHWRRYQFKRELAETFLSALRAIDTASSTKTTSQKSTMLIYADTLESYLQTLQAKRKLKSLKKKLDAMNQNTSESKFSEDKVPF